MSARQAPRRVSMKLVFSVFTIAVVAASVAGVAALSDRNARRALQLEVEMRLVLEARHLSLLSADALLGEYPELTLCPIAREMLQRRPDLEVAVILDHGGHIRGHPDVRRLGERFRILDEFTPRPTLARIDDDETILESARLVAARVPARHPGGQIVGTVLVGQRLDHLDEQLAASRSQVALLAAGLAAVAALLALLVVNRLLAPLDALRAGLRRIGTGDLDSPIRLRSRTELAMLGETIDTMADQIKRSRAETAAREREIIETQYELIHTLGEVVESRSHETGSHVDRVASGTERLAALAGLPPDQCELLRRAAPMHDVGKIGIPDLVLNKPGSLTPEEFDLIKTHTTIGHQILSQSNRPLLQTAALIALQHHERWDGGGYPAGLRGEDIHIYGRIVAIVDVFDALTSHRCYRPAMPPTEALAIMAEGRGSHFDPDLLDLFVSNLDSFAGMLEQADPAAGQLPGATVPPAPAAPARTREAEPVAV